MVPPAGWANGRAGRGSRPVYVIRADRRASDRATLHVMALSAGTAQASGGVAAGGPCAALATASAIETAASGVSRLPRSHARSSTAGSRCSRTAASVFSAIRSTHVPPRRAPRGALPTATRAPPRPRCGRPRRGPRRTATGRSRSRRTRRARRATGAPPKVRAELDLKTDGKVVKNRIHIDRYAPDEERGPNG